MFNFATLGPIFMIPVIGSLFLLISPMDTEKGIHKGKLIGLSTSIIAMIEAIRLWIGFDNSTPQFQYGLTFDWLAGASFHDHILFGLDGISLFFIILTAILIPICILASWDSVKFLHKEFLLCLLGIEFLLFAVFTVLDLLGFYVLFEGILIPMFLMIGIWGSRSEKVRASYYFFFYTLIGSVLMLISIFYIYSLTGTTDYLSLIGFHFDPIIEKLLFLAFFASLAVKIPKIPFHVWLPQAHVEAPVSGSVLLAGLLIKLGSYGFIRYSLALMPNASQYFAPLIYTLAVLGVIYASITTLRQTDLKRIIAYSSVAHMGIVTIGIFTLTAIGIEGSIFLQLSHGIVASALFLIVAIVYDRHHTRLVKYYRGLAITMPLYATFFLIFTLANIAVPLSCNFVGEFVCLISAYESNSTVAIFASLGMVLSASYSLFLYNRVCFGSMSKNIGNTAENRDINRREFIILFPLAFLAILLGVFPQIILDSIHVSVLNLTSLLGGVGSGNMVKLVYTVVLGAATLV